MAKKLVIHHDRIGEAEGKALIDLCPFGAIGEENGRLVVGAGCRMCGICARKGPAGCIELVEEADTVSIDKSQWKGITVYADCSDGRLHPVSLELLGKALELAQCPRQPVYALLIGSQVEEAAETLLRYGADKVYLYDAPALEHFVPEPYTDVLCDFVEKVHPSAILVGATSAGRSVAPRAAARLGTGLTADCTALEMRENTDLVQIRPAFGGNIMAQIITPNHRPQFCTVRYKIFSAPEPQAHPAGELVRMAIPPLDGRTEVLAVEKKPTEMDISEAEVIVAVGRGVKREGDLALIRQLADRLGAQFASTRPLVECGWFDPKRQIGLSGRTVKPKLILTVGISGSVQFCAGMKSSDLIVAINEDPRAPIFQVAHIGLVGDLYEIVPKLLERIGEVQA